MTCAECTKEMTVKHATREAPYAYLESGLDNVCLCGIEIHVCGKCGVEAPVIPWVSQLHRVIGEALAKKPAPLTGAELRFLRKVAGFSAQHFATLIRVTPSHLSKIENAHKERLGPQSDQLARFFALGAIREDELVKSVMDEMAKGIEMSKENARPRQPSLFDLEDGEWKKAA